MRRGAIRVFVGAVIGILCVVLIVAAVALGKAMADSVKALSESAVVSIAEPIRLIEVWEDVPNRCRNWQTCKGLNPIGKEQANGSWLWQCQTCKVMWLYAHKARVLVGMTNTEITFHALPAARQVLPAPKPEAKPKKKGR